jgi:hypothetical protein
MGNLDEAVVPRKGGSMAKDQKLHEVLKGHCQEVIQLLEPIIKGGGAPRRLVNRIELSENGMSHSYAEETDWMRVVLQKEKEIKALTSYSAATGTMKANPNVESHLDKLVGTSEARIRSDAESCLRSIAIEIGQRCLGAGEAFESSFEALYEEIEAYFYSNKVLHRFLAVIEGFSMESDRIDLGNGSGIIRIEKSKRERLLAGGLQFGGFSPASPFATMEYGIEIVMEVPKVIGDTKAEGANVSNMAQAKERIEEVCSCLRLFKKGNFGFNSVRMQGIGWSPQGGDMVTGSLGTKSFLGGGYSLTGAEVVQLSEWWEMYRQTRATPRRGIDLALRRFNVGYERARLEDRLIDYFIGFEALLLKEEERQELDYRLALRGGALLGKNGPEKTQMFSELRAGYRARSKIVHGALPAGTVKVSANQVPFGDLVGRAEELLRLAIKEFLVVCKTKTEEELIEELDTRIVAGQ